MGAREKSCGAVVYTGRGAGRRYVLVQGAAGFWGFPKGHVEDGESEAQTALREIREETGAEAVLIEGFRSTEEYALEREGRPDTVKQVVYFLAEASGEVFEPQDRREIQKVRLMDAGTAMAEIQFADTRRILAEAERFLRDREQPMELILAKGRKEHEQNDAQA